MKILEMLLNLDNEDTMGVYAMSIVNSPAMKGNHILLAAEDLHLKVQDKKKKILTGLAMAPNKLITRYDKKTKEPYQIFFSEDTIEKTSQQFLKTFNQKNITIEHMLSVDNVTVVESWIKTDAEKDKSVALGLEAPVGSWFMTLKVEDDELWDGLLETGLLNGLSIEGQFEAKEVTITELSEINENIKYMDKKETSLIAKIRTLLLGDETNVELEAVAEVSKWWLDLVEGSTYGLGDQLLRKPYEDGGEPYPLSAGEYETEAGDKVLVDAEGYIRYIFDKEVEEAPAVEEEVPAEEVEASEEVELAEGDAPVEEEVETVTYELTPEEVILVDEFRQAKIDAEAEAEAPVETVEASIAEVIEVVKEKVEVEPQLIPHTDAELRVRKPKAKFDYKLTVQERIKQGLGTL